MCLEKLLWRGGGNKETSILLKARGKGPDMSKLQKKKKGIPTLSKCQGKRVNNGCLSPQREMHVVKQGKDSIGAVLRLFETGEWLWSWSSAANPQLNVSVTRKWKQNWRPLQKFPLAGNKRCSQISCQHVIMRESQVGSQRSTPWLWKSSAPQHQEVVWHYDYNLEGKY